MPGPGVPWSPEFGDRIKVTVLDNVLQAQDAERVFRQLAAQGNRTIIGTTFSQYATLRKLAPTLPKVNSNAAPASTR